jgi:hypothetical protein
MAPFSYIAEMNFCTSSLSGMSAQTPCPPGMKRASKPSGDTFVTATLLSSSPLVASACDASDSQAVTRSVIKSGELLRIATGKATHA